MRSLVAGICILIGAVELLVGFEAAKGPGQISALVFASLGAICAVYGLLGGTLDTADTLSREKRAETLGLLMITRLRPMDIVFAKLFPCLQNLGGHILAVLPVPALTMLLGGVAPLDLLVLLLAALNLLFFGAAMGLLASAIARDASKSVVLAVALCLMPVALSNSGLLLNPVPAAAVMPVVNKGFAASMMDILTQFVEWTQIPRSGGMQLFVIRHLLLHAFGWLGLALAAWWLPFSMKGVRVPKLWRFGTLRADSISDSMPDRRQKFPSWFDDPNPLLGAFYFKQSLTPNWLSILCVLLALGLGTIAFVKSNGDGSHVAVVIVFLGALYYSLLRMLGGMNAFWSYAQDLESGAFEILLTTPIDPAAISRGRFLLLKRRLMTPFLILSLPYLTAFLFSLMLPNQNRSNPLLLRIGLGLLGLLVLLAREAIDCRGIILFGAIRALKSTSVSKGITATILLSLGITPFQFISAFSYYFVIFGDDMDTTTAFLGLLASLTLSMVASLGIHFDSERVLVDQMREKCQEDR